MTSVMTIHQDAIQPPETRASTIFSIPNNRKNVVDFIMNNSISLGYLMAFCNVQHNSENLNFIIVVDKFKDKFSDPSCWNKSWREIDEEVSIKNIRPGKLITFGDKDYWPSKLYSRESIETEVREIWDNYLSDEGWDQICLGSEVVRQTSLRMDRIDLYGPEIFGEAVIDPIKTISRDIVPRFLKSEYYETLNTNILKLENLPSASTLVVPPPVASLIDDATLESLTSDRQYDINELISDKYLYDRFLTYLRHIVSSENLLFVRMIAIFDELVELNQTEANEQSWKIYKYFVAQGSSLEVSCSYIQRKAVMRNLAYSNPGDFDELKKTALTMLQVNFQTYQATPGYSDLGDMMRRKRIELDASNTTPNKGSLFSCLGRN